jgi:hypothetical protein
MFINRIQSKSLHHKLDKGEQRFAVEINQLSCKRIVHKKIWSPQKNYIPRTRRRFIIWMSEHQRISIMICRLQLHFTPHLIWMQAERQENQLDHLQLHLLPLCKQQQEYWLIKFHIRNRLQHSRNVSFCGNYIRRFTHPTKQINKQTKDQPQTLPCWRIGTRIWQQQTDDVNIVGGRRRSRKLQLHRERNN